MRAALQVAALGASQAVPQAPAEWREVQHAAARREAGVPPAAQEAQVLRGAPEMRAVVEVPGAGAEADPEEPLE